MKCEKCEKSAKEFLLKTIKNKRLYENFKIINTQNITLNKNNGCCYLICLIFQCTYEWKLNGWSKLVEREIIVVYNINNNKYYTSL